MVDCLTVQYRCTAGYLQAGQIFGHKLLLLTHVLQTDISMVSREISVHAWVKRLEPRLPRLPDFLADVTSGCDSAGAEYL